jgi:tetratricopeptide (TPR) repeat protein
LEQAACYLEELGRPDPELARAAGDRLARAGGRTYWLLGDFNAAAGLLERALRLTRPYRLDVCLEAELVNALDQSDIAQALAVADSAAERADAAGDEAGVALARAIAAKARNQMGECSAEELERLARAAVPLLEAAGDDDGLCHVWQAIGWVANNRSQLANWEQAIEQAIVHARRAGHPIRGSWAMSVPLAMGPRPASEALAKLDSLLSDQPHPGDLAMRAVLLAMLDQVEEAWAVALPASEKGRELGMLGEGAWLAEIAAIAGDLEAAADYLREACAELELRHMTAVLSSDAPQLGRVLCALGRADEAEPLARLGQELGGSDDVLTQALWRQARALVHSARAEHSEAEQLAREAVDWIERSDALPRQGDAYLDLAQVLEAAGNRHGAIGARHEALDRYQRKQIIPLVRRVREQLSALRPT